MHGIKRLACLGMTALFLTAAACSDGKHTDKAASARLTVAYDSSRYGSGWLAAVTAAFEKADPGVKVTIDDSLKLDSQIDLMMASGSGLPDVAFLGRTNWQTWAAGGSLCDLTGMMTAAGSGGTIADRLQPGVRSACMQSGRYWVLPLSDGMTGLIYNAGLFEKYGWAIPRTVQELNNLLPQIRAKGIAPFAWSTQGIAYWEDDVDNWWAQADGADGMAAYLKMDSSAVYSSPGRLRALETFGSLVTAANSIDSPGSVDNKKAAAEFYDGRAAMMPGGYLPWIESKDRPPADLDIRMMRLPAVDGARQADIGRSLAGDFAVIPARAEDARGAEQFLSFMSRADMLSVFTENTGLPRPFVYDARAVSGLDTLARSAAQLWQTDDKVYAFSPNPAYGSTLFDWPYAGSPLYSIYAGAQTARQAFDLNVQYASGHWDASH